MANATVDAAGRTATTHTLFEKGTGTRTEINMLTDATRRTVSFAIGRAEDGASRACAPHGGVVLLGYWPKSAKVANRMGVDGT